MNKKEKKLKKEIKKALKHEGDILKDQNEAPVIFVKEHDDV